MVDEEKRQVIRSAIGETLYRLIEREGIHPAAVLSLAHSAVLSVSFQMFGASATRASLLNALDLVDGLSATGLLPDGTPDHSVRVN